MKKILYKAGINKPIFVKAAVLRFLALEVERGRYRNALFIPIHKQGRFIYPGIDLSG